MAHLTQKLTPSKLNNIHVSLCSLCEQVYEHERTVTSGEDKIDDRKKCVQTFEKENAYLKDKVDDTENRGRSSNLHFINVLDQSEGRHAFTFLNQLIPTEFPLYADVSPVDMSPLMLTCSQPYP